MKTIKKLLVIVCLTAMVLSFVPQAGAQVYEDSYFEGKTWEDVMETFLAEHNITEDYTFTCGYKNLITGEEHFVNPEEYKDAASLYKVPMNMIFSNKVYNGEINWDTSYNGYRYSYIQEATIVNSNNELASYLWNALGGYQAYRRILAPVCGEDPDNVDAMFYKNNFFTARQVIYYLNELYQNSYKYPGVIEKMLEAEKEQYFKRHSHDVEIAHKYGYNTTDYHFYLNDSAICYTEDPIAIVCFTDNVNKPYDVLADYCDLMIDYAQYSHGERIIREAEEAREAAIAALNAPAQEPAVQTVSAEQPVQESAETVEMPEIVTAPVVVNAAPEPSNIGNYVMILLVLILAIAGVAAVLILSYGKKLNKIWAVLAVLTTAAALMIWPISKIVGSNVKPIEDDPQEVVTQFFQALESGDYPTVYDCLYEYYDLGLQNTPATSTGVELYDALKDSYSFELYGESQVTKADAVQQVLFSHLNLKALKADLQTETEKIVHEMVEERPADEIYDENEKYLTSFLDEAYNQAVKNLLARSQNYRTTTGLNVQLTYTNGLWKIKGDAVLLNAVCGGAAY